MNQDWNFLMSDRIPRRDRLFERKQDQGKYLLEIPFGAGDYSRLNARSPQRKSDELSILNNIPVAVVNGHNIYNLFTRLSVGYQDSLDFNRMPIPFACVAVDLASKQEVVFHDGRFVDVIRASMAIPGYFSPVRLGDKVLVDGGALNNFPVDVCREMGADIVIGVLINDPGTETADVDNIGDIVSQLASLYMDTKVPDAIAHTDLLIQPETKAYNMLSFDDVSLRALIDSGEVAARKKQEAFAALKDDSPEAGFNGNTCAVLTTIDGQSGDIAMGVDASFDDKTIGAGDQGMMFGFACDETEELMPAPIGYAHNLTRALSALRKNGTLPWLRPDGKSQVSVQYDETGRPERIDTVVVSTQHAESIDIDTLRQTVIDTVIRPNLPKRLLDADTKFYVNPTGRFVIGGPAADSGLTGRKIIVDTYGGYAAHGGGAFSGKDPTKVDRSAAYMARYIAKNVVASGLARKCQIELAYAIGVAQPVSVLVDTYGTGTISDGELSELVRRCFDLRPAAIIERLDLRRPIYQPTAAYGHFGRTDLDLPWERTDVAFH